ncbi:MAG: dihydroorotate dehydrogenase electron transfer subunit [Candidatus Aminicenantes bacterium]|jgi:dihydroorotate dehydrogenase electron transfer subunit
MKKDSLARIARKQSWGEYFLFALESPTIAQCAEPGQFLMVRVSPNTHPLLRRPFSIFSAEGQNIQIFFQRVGLGTRLLSEKQEGEAIDIIGPLGTGFTINQENQNKNHALVGGGRGIAPLYFLSQKLRTHGAKAMVFYGGKSLQDLPVRESFEKSGMSLFLSTEDGSFGAKGMITDVFEEELKNGVSLTQIYACGPDPMLKKVSEIGAALNIPAELSLESVMGCGFGACWGCVKKIRKDQETGWHKICEEGPVIRSENIIWERENDG